MSFFPPINISKTQSIYFFKSLYVEVSRYQTLSIFSDVISDQMSLVAVRMTSFSSFLSCLPLSKWNSCKSLETLLFNITTSDIPSLWQNVMNPLKKIFSLSSHMVRAISFRFYSQKFGFRDSNTVGCG